MLPSFWSPYVNWFSAMKKSRRQSKPTNKRRRFQPVVDRLEDRLVPANYSAGTAAQLITDMGLTQNAGTSTITLTANITLTTSNNFHDGGLNGLPQIVGENLTINGNGHTIQRSSTTSCDFRIFDVDEGSTLNLNGLTVKNGELTGPCSLLRGGGIFVEEDAKLNLNFVTVCNNSLQYVEGEEPESVTLQGGGIYNDGTATISNSLIKNNSVTYSFSNNESTTIVSNGSLSSATPDSGANGGSSGIVVQGGGIYNDNIMTLLNTGVVSNTASFTLTQGTGFGSGFGNFNGTPEVSNSVITPAESGGNNCGNGINANVNVDGGGIFNDGVLIVNITLGIPFNAIVNNVASSSITNGTVTSVASGAIKKAVTPAEDEGGNGSNDGNDNEESDNGNNNGNGLNGNVSVEGGGLFNDGTTSILFAVISGNIATSTVVNGSGNGNDDGNGNGTEDSIVPDCDLGNGNGNGNGVSGTVTAAGGGVYNNSVLTLNGGLLLKNFAISSVTNGSFNGDGDGNGNGFDNNGNDNGNGVFGEIFVLGGGLANSAFGVATINAALFTGNGATSTVTNGCNNGDCNGNENSSSDNGDGDGNGVEGDLFIGGGAIDNESGCYSTGVVIVTACLFGGNCASSTVTNGSNDGNFNGNNSCSDNSCLGDGNGVDGEVQAGGGAIHNDGSFTVTACSFTLNTVSSTVTNGSCNGNGNGNCDSNDDNGDGNGNGVSNPNCIAIQLSGGAISDGGVLIVTNSLVTLNAIKSKITNGSHDGSGNGQSDGDNTYDGDDNGNGVSGGLLLDGGGIGSDNNLARGLDDSVAPATPASSRFSATLVTSTVTYNSATSTVTNGTSNGGSNGGGSDPSDGQGNGNGLDGDLFIFGGGTAQVLVINSSVTNNTISSTPSSHPNGDNGLILDGDIDLFNPNIFFETP